MDNRAKKRIVLGSIGLVIIAGFIIYANSLNGKFIWDDEVLVKHNRYIKNWSNMSKIFTEDSGAGGGGFYGFYRPLQLLSYTIEYFLWGLDVRGYHCINVLLHILAALSVYWLINILYNDKLLSLFTGLLFIAHPIHTEAVSYISGRADPLAALFILLCFVLYIKQLTAQSKKLYICMVLSYCAALLSREGSLILPVLIVLYHYSFNRRFHVIGFLTIAGMALLYIVLRMTLLQSLLPHISHSATFFQRMPGFFVAITNYTRLLLLPFNLHMEYGKRIFSFTDPKAIVGAVLLLSSLTYAIIKRKTNRLIFFSIFWFFVILLPVSNLYPMNAYMAEHWLYLPSVGFFLVVSDRLCSIYRIRKFRTIAILLAIALLAFYSYLTIRQNGYWSDRISFYKRTIKYAPESSRLYNNLADIYIDSGKSEEAITLLKKGIEVSPNDAYVYNNLGRAYTSVGRYKEAITAFKRAIEINPNLGEAYNNLAIVYYYEKRYESAVEYSDRAMQLGHKVDSELLRSLNPYRNK